MAKIAKTAFEFETVVTLAMVVTCLGLGIWQLQRRVEKHALIAALNERLVAVPEALPPPKSSSAKRKQAARGCSITAWLMKDSASTSQPGSSAV